MGIITREPPDGLFGSSRCPLECKNVGTVEIPPFGVADIIGAFEKGDRIVLEVTRPVYFGWRPGSIVVGPFAIAAGSFGACTDSRFVKVAYDDADGVPEKDQVWGPVADSSKIRKHVPGGLVLRDGEDGLVLVRRYEPLDIWCKLTEDLEPGGTADVLLTRGDDTGADMELDDVTAVAFEISEFTGGTDTIAADTIVFARWDEWTKKYHLRGWVC